MPILALDTSSGTCVAVLSDAGAVLAAASSDEPRHHAELLAPMITAALADAGVDRRELTAVVAGTGPAPFTGLRVGLVTARTLALALGVPVWGVPSLDAIAVRAAAGAAPGTRLLVVTDARRREVYWASYDVTAGGGIATSEGPDLATPEALRASGRIAGALVVGRGALLHAAELALPGRPATLDPDPADLARLALARHAAGFPLPPEPLYLRRPDAEPPASPKRALA
ncbi:MAG TPA: tRNA (adenosine(37)-N6)-threonylcarbamoyltransferase complex dimerization subunit type 1 TsaB [Cellulomonas sp.]